MHWISFPLNLKKTLVLLGVTLALLAGALAVKVTPVEARSWRHYRHGYYRHHRPYYQQRRYYRSSRPYVYQQRRYYRHHRYDRRYR